MESFLRMEKALEIRMESCNNKQKWKFIYYYIILVREVSDNLDKNLPLMLQNYHFTHFYFILITNRYISLIYTL